MNGRCVPLGRTTFSSELLVEARGVATGFGTVVVGGFGSSTADEDRDPRTEHEKARVAPEDVFRGAVDRWGETSDDSTYVFDRDAAREHLRDPGTMFD